MIELNDTHAAMLGRLEAIRRGDGRRLEVQDIEYWGERFGRLYVRFWAGCTFERYLTDPSFWEKIVEIKRLARRHYRGPEVVVVMKERGYRKYLVSLN